MSILDRITKVMKWWILLTRLEKNEHLDRITKRWVFLSGSRDGGYCWKDYEIKPIVDRITECRLLLTGFGKKCIVDRITKYRLSLIGLRHFAFCWQDVKMGSILEWIAKWSLLLVWLWNDGYCRQVYEVDIFCWQDYDEICVIDRITK